MWSTQHHRKNFESSTFRSGHVSPATMKGQPKALKHLKHRASDIKDVPLDCLLVLLINYCSRLRFQSVSATVGPKSTSPILISSVTSCACRCYWNLYYGDCSSNMGYVLPHKPHMSIQNTTTQPYRITDVGSGASMRRNQVPPNANNTNYT